MLHSNVNQLLSDPDLIVRAAYGTCTLSMSGYLTLRGSGGGGGLGGLGWGWGETERER